jgi:hypothetical protein
MSDVLALLVVDPVSAIRKHIFLVHRGNSVDQGDIAVEPFQCNCPFGFRVGIEHVPGRDGGFRKA